MSSIPGTDGHELYYSSECSTTLEFAEGKIKVKQTNETAGYGLRILKNKKIGFSHFASENDCAAAVNNAILLSKYSKKTGFSFAPKRKYPDAKTFSEKTANLDEQELKEMVAQIQDGTSKYTKLCRIILDAGTSKTGIENSEGLYAACSYSGMSTYCEAMNKDGFGFSYYSGVCPLSDPHGFGEKTGRMSKEMQGAKKLQSGKYDVVFSVESFHSMLDILLPSMSGDWKRKKITRLWNKHGEKIFSEKFSISNDSLAEASCTTPFDDEGVPSGKICLIERGVLKNFLYDRETAALEKVAAEGACARNSFSSPPTISRSNLIVSPGSYSSFENELNEFILVKSVHGIHTSNTTTGDFGIEGNVAFRVKDGKNMPVRGFMISGNIFNVFNGIIGLERKTEVYDNLIAPRIACSKMQIIG